MRSVNFHNKNLKIKKCNKKHFEYLNCDIDSKFKFKQFYLFLLFLGQMPSDCVTTVTMFVYFSKLLVTQQESIIQTTQKYLKVVLSPVKIDFQVYSCVIKCAFYVKNNFDYFPKDIMLIWRLVVKFGIGAYTLDINIHFYVLMELYSIK